MKIAILGTGIVGQTLAGRLIALNYEVQMGTRDVQKTLVRTSRDNYGNPSFHEWHENNKQIKLVTFSEAATFGDIIINATNGSNTIAVLKTAGTAGLHGKTLLDLSNPLDFSKGMPPTLIASYCNNNSLGEEIQRSFPKINVVKALNTMWCGIMVNPDMIQSGDHHAFICGNDVGAKMKVTDLLRHFGWKENRIIDLGDISASRGTEMILPLWLKIMNNVGSGAFNFKIVRN